MSNNSKYEDKILAKIFLDVNYPGIEIRGFETIVILCYCPEDYQKIIDLVKALDFTNLKSLYKDQAKTFADLGIYRFHDEKNLYYTALVYDSDELWQDPELWEIIPDPLL